MEPLPHLPLVYYLIPYPQLHFKRVVSKIHRIGKPTQHEQHVPLSCILITPNKRRHIKYHNDNICSHGAISDDMPHNIYHIIYSSPRQISHSTPNTTPHQMYHVPYRITPLNHTTQQLYTIELTTVPHLLSKR